MQSSVCEFLPIGRKLCDLGTYQAFPSSDADDSFVFATIVQLVTSYNIIGVGRFLLRIVASATNCEPAVVVLSLRTGGGELDLEAADQAMLLELQKADAMA